MYRVKVYLFKDINMKYIKQILLLACILCGKLSFGQTYNIEVGETLQLNVPSVPVGYVDKAIWACSNPAIIFISKSEIRATIKATKNFDGYAIIELVYVERYVDNKGFTRANTYSKNFYVSCIGNSGNNSTQNATSILIQPELTVEIGEQVKIPYQLLPIGSTADIWSTSYPGTHFNGLTTYEQEQYIKGWARSAGTDEVTLYFYDENDNKISATCIVTVCDPTWILPESINVPSVLLLSKGEQYKILPSLYPKTATTIYEWKSDNTTVASISQGTVKANKIGAADITIKTSNGLLAKCSIIVVEDKTQFKGIPSALNRVANMLKIAEEDIIQ